MFCCTPCIFLFLRNGTVYNHWLMPLRAKSQNEKNTEYKKDLKVIQFSKQNKTKMCWGLRKNMNSKSRS